MAAAGHGSIVNIGSIQGMIGPSYELYERHRHRRPAARLFLPQGRDAEPRALLCRTLRPRRAVRVNCVSPGGFFNHQPESFVKHYCEHTMLNRMADNHDLGGAVIFLLGDASRYITGTNLPVDGGLHGQVMSCFMVFSRFVAAIASRCRCQRRIPPGNAKNGRDDADDFSLPWSALDSFPSHPCGRSARGSPSLVEEVRPRRIGRPCIGARRQAPGRQQQETTHAVAHRSPHRPRQTSCPAPADHEALQLVAVPCGESLAGVA